MLCYLKEIRDKPGQHLSFGQFMASKAGHPCIPVMPRGPTLTVTGGDFSLCDFAGCTIVGDVSNTVFSDSNMAGIRCARLCDDDVLHFCGGWGVVLLLASKLLSPLLLLLCQMLWNHISCWLLRALCAVPVRLCCLG